MLDNLPVFACVNNRGQLCEFKFPAREQPVPVFYVDVEEARVALSQAQEDYPLLGVDIVPMGLGDAFRYNAGGVGLLVPGIPDLMAAGAPPGADPMQEMRAGPFLTKLRLRLRRCDSNHNDTVNHAGNVSQGCVHRCPTCPSSAAWRWPRRALMASQCFHSS